MKTKPKAVRLMLLIPALVCILIGEWHLGVDTRLMEYAVPYESPDLDTEDTIPLLTALQALHKQLPGTSLSAFALARDEQILLASDQSAVCTVYAIAPGYFDLYPHRLLSGRLLGEGEILNGAKNVLIDANLAYALWGDLQIIGQTLLLQNEVFQVVGVMAAKWSPGWNDAPMLYLPLPAAAQIGMAGDIQVLSGIGGTVSAFETAAKAAFPGGTFYYLQKERMRAGLPVRYLCVLLAAMGLHKLFRGINISMRRELVELKEKSTRVYVGRMIGPTTLFCLQGIICYGLWLLLVYFTLQCAVVPAYLFSEWVPENPSRLSNYQAILQNLLGAQAPLRTTVTETVLSLRAQAALIRIGCLFILLILL